MRMSEWLTTGQMIDEIYKLDPFVVYESEDGNKVAQNASGELKYCDEKGNTKYGSVLLQDVIFCKWKLLPNYVSFEEAMKALSDEKTVRYHYQLGGKNTYLRLSIETKPSYFNNETYWDDLVNGNWTIEADTQ
jgi:hypothetical protein